MDQMRSRDTNDGSRESRVSTVVSVSRYMARAGGAGPRGNAPHTDRHTRHVSVTAILFHSVLFTVRTF